LQLCGEHLTDGGSPRRKLAFEVVVEQLSFLLYRGLFDDLTVILAPERLHDREKRRVMNAIDRFLQIEEDEGRDNLRVQQYLDEIQNWAEGFRPSDFAGRLRSICARDPWDRRFSSDATNPDEMDEIASVVIDDPGQLNPQLDWLSSEEAKSAERLGHAIGKADESLGCSRVIAEHAVASGSAPLLRGYVRGLVFSDRSPNQELLDCVSRLGREHPHIAADILTYGGDRFDGLDRVIRLVESNSLSARYLANFAMGVGNRDLEIGEVARLIPYFTRAIEEEDFESARAGVRFLSTCLHFREKEDGARSFDDLNVQVHSWDLVETTLPVIEHNLAREWSEIGNSLAVWSIFGCR